MEVFFFTDLLFFTRYPHLNSVLPTHYLIIPDELLRCKVNAVSGNLYLRYFVYFIPPCKFLILICPKDYFHFISEIALLFLHTKESQHFFTLAKDFRQC